eukprot:CAMPEP_0206229818 /NCGR_PEP_ID=MMETSP0047_2-20121206/9905_1 /ASSEMBLY_ACC=CAM_ASM_000192 /TAXON_ID=195065 /ORGANISM="Chroomonas mesostigmatica_cf, Strain CCMP1168" /LENGTH=136 /DNA_ID=CAMNT_0053653153 /DNA_START=17 /DNA_END=428 /DNA_ORIENTATION=+
MSGTALEGTDLGLVGHENGGDSKLSHLSNVGGKATSKGRVLHRQHLERVPVLPVRTLPRLHIKLPRTCPKLRCLLHVRAQVEGWHLLPDAPPPALDDFAFKVPAVRHYHDCVGRLKITPWDTLVPQDVAPVGLCAD